MAEYVLVHGSWHNGASFDPLARVLRERGHTVVAPDLPATDPAAGIAEYVEAVDRAMGGLGPDVIVLGHSLGGLTIAELTMVRPVGRLVYLCALVPVPHLAARDVVASMPGELTFDPPPTRNDDGTTSVSAETARRAFYDDAAPEAAAAATAHLRRQGTRPMRDVCRLSELPSVPTTYVLCRDDHSVPVEMQREFAERVLHVIPIEIDGGHSPFLVRPEELANVLESLI